MNDNNDLQMLQKSYIDLASAMISTYKPESTIYTYKMFAEIDKIKDAAKKMVWDAYQDYKAKLEYENSEIYLEDLVVLSIDNSQPTRYWLGRSTNNWDVDLINGKTRVSSYEPLPEENLIVKKILGKHVGDEITYTEDNEKNQHTVKILSVQKTVYSRKINVYEVEADMKKYTKIMK